MEKLAAADIAFARVNDSTLLSKHPHLRRITVGRTERSGVDAGAARRCMPARSAAMARSPRSGEHTEKIRKEFAG